MKVVAIIIARGGSKRLPRKNVLPFAGKSLTAWSVIQAVSSHLISQTYMVTDDLEIADISMAHGASVIFQPHKDAEESGEWGGPLTTLHALNRIDGFDSCDAMVSILPTSPLRKPDDIDNAIMLLREKNVPEIMSVVRLADIMLLQDIGYNLAEKRCYLRESTPLIGAGGFGVSTPGFARWSTERALRERDHFSALQTHAYYELELWQSADVDFAREFEIAEYWFNKKILSQGEDVYERYANTARG